MDSPALSTHFSHLRGKQSIAALFLSAVGRFKEAMRAVLILSSTEIVFPEHVLSHVKTSNNHMGYYGDQKFITVLTTASQWTTY
jgi:hypothetical protein